MTKKKHDRYNISVNGNVSGQIVAGSHNAVSRVEASPTGHITERDLAELEAAFAEVRTLIRAEALAEAESAEEQLTLLENATLSSQPDLNTMDSVRQWFARYLPKLAGAVSSLFVHPVVGRLVEHAGDTIAAEFRRRFTPP